jgi:hypothetical protein
MPGWHGGAVPAQPTRGYLGRTSPCSTRSTAPRALPPALHTRHDHLRDAQQAPGKNLARRRDRRRQELAEPDQETAEISSERRRPPNLTGGGGRGRCGGRFSPGGGGEGHRRWPGSVGGGGDIGRRRGLGRGRGESERGRVDWVGLTDPDRSLPG